MTDGSDSFQVGVVQETFPEERRVAVVPASVKALSKASIDVLIESGAGEQAGFGDEAYSDAGAEVVGTRAHVFARSDAILMVRAAGANPERAEADLPLFQEGQILIALGDPLGRPKYMAQLAERGVTCFALELVPRITRAQSMDVLSSMASIAGYKSVLLAAAAAPRMFPMMMTAAGTITPARVFVVGAGVAGLQAIATAKRLGAVIHAYDIRTAAKEEAVSLGAKFVELELESSDTEQAGGYAKAMDEDFYRRQRELMARVVADSDIVITTAAVPGKKAPVLITAEMVEKMAAGSILVDLAAEQGGNCELTEPNQTRVEHGVTIIGTINLSSTVPFHASQMYSRNITTLLTHLLKDGSADLDREDEIIQQTMVTRGGTVVHAQVRTALGLDAGEEEAEGGTGGMSGMSRSESAEQPPRSTESAQTATDTDTPTPDQTESQDLEGDTDS